MKKSHRHTSLALTVAACLLTAACDQPNHTLLTSEGRRELGISQLRVQCQPNNNGLSIGFKNRNVIAFFTTGQHFVFKRILNNRQHTISANANNINDPDNLLSAIQLTKTLNAFCAQAKAVNGQHHNDGTEAPADIPTGIVYQLSETGTSYTANQAWEETALQMLERFRIWSESLRKEQSTSHKARSWGQQQNITLN